MTTTETCLLTGERLHTALEAAAQQLPAALENPLPLEDLLRSVARFSRLLKEGTVDLPLNEAQRDELLSYCDPALLRLKIERELGDHAFELRRINYREQHFEAWRPLGCVVHVMPSNAPLLPFLAVLESLLAGNVNWVRPSSNEHLSSAVLQALIACDDGGLLRNFVVMWPIAATDVGHLLRYADGVSAWGGDAALESVRQQLPAGCRWIPWGHKISFAYLTEALLPVRDNSIEDVTTAADYDAGLDAIADAVCRYDQQACSSPQLLLVDSDDPALLRRVGQDLARALERRTIQQPAENPDLHQRHDVHSFVNTARLAQAFENQEGHIWSGDGWHVVWQHLNQLEASPLHRTVLLRPLPRRQLCASLREWRGYLQTCGLLCAGDEVAQLSRQLVAAGVGRITMPHAMHDGYIGEPHDNERALTRLVRRVSVTLPENMCSGRASLDCIPATSGHGLHRPDLQPQILDRRTFAESGYDEASARLFFRSGGTTGTPILAAFSYGDYHRQMRAAADGLFAAGLDPNTDRVINLLESGNLYGGLLSSFLALDKLDAVHFPMGNPYEGDHAATAELMIRQRINTIIGTPSAVYLLFQRAGQQLRAYGGVRKIFVAGEHLSRSQRSFLSSFDRPLIRSAMYGSNDAGPLAHACADSEEGVFHVLAGVQNMEVVAVDEDRPVPAGVAGRLLFTSLAREAQHVVRYDIGDLGYLLDSPCACGLTTPRFRLLGRHGNLLRLGPAFIDINLLMTCLDMPAQLIIDAANGVDRLTVSVEGDIAVAQSRLADAPGMQELLQLGLVQLHVRADTQTSFVRNVHSGKVAIVIDRRLQ